MTTFWRLLVALLIIGHSASASAPGGSFPFPTGVRRVLFLGNSITYAGQYVTAIETYVLMHYPAQPVTFINAGLPSETVSGLSEDGHADGQFPRPDLHERLARVLAQTKPDLVIACYGMNDGIYLPFNDDRFSRFKTGIEWLHDEVVKTGARIIHLTPPDYDDQRGGKPGYSAVLDRYADWLMTQQQARQWQVIDIHYPMKTYLAAHRRVDSTFAVTGFALANDGVHPGEVGHWLIARSVLVGLGETAVARAPNLLASLPAHASQALIVRLVSERQALMKDAWLTATGHKRPGMKTGLPLPEAQAKAEQIEAQLREALRRDAIQRNAIR